LNQVKHIFFDLDHTLWDFDANSKLAFEYIFKLNKIDVNIEDFVSKYEPINRNYWKLYERNEIQHEELRLGRLRDSFFALEYFVEDKELELLSELYIKHLTDNNVLIDGALDILDYLSKKYQLHIITNGFSYVQEKKLEKSELLSYFSTITNSEMAGEKKPSKRIFEFALNSAGAKKEESIMVGDSFEADVLGAENFGIKAIYFAPNKSDELHDFIEIKSLLELKNYL
jgi:YjjG family noncanonical pyrimidine nucleotidase